MPSLRSRLGAAVIALQSSKLRRAAWASLRNSRGAANAAKAVGEAKVPDMRSSPRHSTGPASYEFKCIKILLSCLGKRPDCASWSRYRCKWLSR